MIMGARIAGIVAALVLLLPISSRGAVDGGLVALPGAALTDCVALIPGAAPAPIYPPEAESLKRGGLVRVRLTFEGPASEPKATVFYNQSFESFSNAVLSHVRNYRLPCMAAGAEPVLATQEFRFTLDERKVFFGGVRDQTETRPIQLCLMGDRRPIEYPRNLQGKRPQGNVVAILTFFDPSEPPKVEIVTDAGSSALRRAVLESVEHYRMPCVAASGKPIKARRVFSFAMEGAKQYTLKDLNLQQFVDGIDKLDQQRVRFDLSSMKCPFEVRLTLLQPFAKNQVGEIEQSDPNRRELIEWLKDVALKLPSDAAPQLIGQSMIIAVPCGVLDLT